MEVRKFWLENQNGEIWHFTSKESNTFLMNPTGLGISTKHAAYRLGNTEVVTAMQNELLDITGTLVFYKENRENVYQRYFSFVKFIANNSYLKLHYQTPNSFDSFYCYCFVKGLNKTEVDRDGTMKCPIVFKTQTYWRNDNVNNIIVNNGAVGESKDYPLGRPYSYAMSSFSQIILMNNGNIETPLKITITGTVTNPLLKLYDGNNEYGAMRMIGTFDEVLVNSDDLNESIQLKKDGSILTAPYSYQDLSIGSPLKTYVTFLKLKPGTSVATFTFDGSFSGDLMIEWSDEYVSI